MNIYIASSWKNQHAVQMLTTMLTEAGHRIFSFVENCGREEHNVRSGKLDFDQWVWEPEGTEKFEFDLHSIDNSDLVVYIGPSGTDAWAEVGYAFGSGTRVLGLWAKGEPAGLMRRMVEWHKDFHSLFAAINCYARSIESASSAKSVAKDSE